MSEIKDTIDEQLGGTLSKAETFYEKNRKPILYGGIALIVIVLGYLGYNYMIQNKEAEANTKLFMIEQYFEQDSFDLALNGSPANPDYPGALAFIDEYSGTPAAQKAAYIAGRAYMAKGDYTTAIEYLEKFKLDDKLVRAQAIGLVGDCYSELGNMEDAEKYYKNAASHSANQYTTPKYLKKLGLVQESQGKYKEAAESYAKIKKDYPESEQGRDIEKYLARANAKAGVNSFEY